MLPMERAFVNKGLVLAGLAGLLGLVLAPACGGAHKARQKARRAQKVDCAQLCTRSFKRCAAEVVVAAGNTKPERVAALKATGAFEKIQSVGYEACLRDCNKKQGRGSDAGRINECLAKRAAPPSPSVSKASFSNGDDSAPHPGGRRD